MRNMPKTLRDLQALALALCASEFDDKRRWKHYKQFRLLRAQQALGRSTKRFELEVLQLAQVLLAPFAAQQACRDLRGKWTNPRYCPDTDDQPYGNYHWTFAVEMVQEIVWLQPAFVEGFRFGRKPVEPFRDANPYFDPGRQSAWDHGYILGLTEPAILRGWTRERQERAAARVSK